MWQIREDNDCEVYDAWSGRSIALAYDRASAELLVIMLNVAERALDEGLDS